MSTEYTTIRVPVAVARDLRRFAEDLEHQAGDGRLTIPDLGGNGLGHCPNWFAISVLLDRVQRHRERARLSRSARSKKRSRRAGCIHPLRGVAA